MTRINSRLIPLQHDQHCADDASAILIDTQVGHAALFEAAQSRHDLVRNITEIMALVQVDIDDNLAVPNLFYSLNVLMDEAARLHSAAYYAATHHQRKSQND